LDDDIRVQREQIVDRCHERQRAYRARALWITNHRTDNVDCIAVLLDYKLLNAAPDRAESDETNPDGIWHRSSPCSSVRDRLFTMKCVNRRSGQSERQHHPTRSEPIVYTYAASRTRGHRAVVRQ